VNPENNDFYKCLMDIIAKTKQRYIFLLTRRKTQAIFCFNLYIFEVSNGFRKRTMVKI